MRDPDHKRTTNGAGLPDSRHVGVGHRTAQKQCVIPRFVFESGRIMEHLTLAYRTWGRLNETKDNAVVVCHTLTGNTNVPQWWSGLFGRGRSLDPGRSFIVCVNLLGSCYGSSGPTTTNPKTGRPYGPDFPVPTIRDQVAAQAHLLRELGVRRIETVIGASLGGMLALEFAFLGSFVRTIVPIAVSGRHSAWCIAWSEAQRAAVMADPRWNDGRYDPANPPVDGMEAARKTAMISYRTPQSFERKFGRSEAPDGRFDITSYLDHQGRKFSSRFDANSLVALTRSTNTHDIARGRNGYVGALTSITQPALIIGIDSDALFPLHEQKELARHLPRASLYILHSHHGHDAFLIEPDQLDPTIRSWLSRGRIESSLSKAKTEPCRST